MLLHGKRKKFDFLELRFFALTFAIVALSCLNLLARTVQLELEEVPHATGYQVELTDKHSSKSPQIFKLTEPLWKTEISPGVYSIRTRTFDKRGVPGEWSDASDLVVRLKAPELLSPKLNSVIESQESQTQEVRFEWKAVAGAKKYKLKYWEIPEKPFEKTVDENEATITLPVAKKYSWQVQALQQFGEKLEDGDASKEFSLEILGAKLFPPQILEIAPEKTTEIRWSGPEQANSFTFSLERKDAQENWKPWYQRETKNNFQLYKNPLPKGEYRVKVRATTDRRPASDWSERIFTTEPELRDLKKEQATFHQPHGSYFALAKYDLGFINYLGSNPDNRIKSTGFESGISGTGAFGVGKWLNQNSSMGLVFIAGLSGLSTEGTQTQTFTYMSASLEAIYRLLLGSWGQLTFTLGPKFRQLPEILSTSSETKSQTIATIGLQMGLTYSYSFTRKLGAQFFLSAYPSLMGMGETASTNEQTMSFQYGLGGTLRLKDSLRGSVGIVQKSEKASYRATSVGVNQLQLKGTYLILQLEYGF